MSTCKAIIFDLGNVIFRFSYEATLARWADELHADVSAVRSRFSFDHEYEQFEKGVMGPREYISHATDRLGISEDSFITGWNSIYREIIPGIPALLENLKRNYRIVALSNTNILHYPVWMEQYHGVLRHFEKIFVSHQIGARKPEKEAYQHVLDYLHLSPAETVFLDDIAGHVVSARELDIHGIVVSSFDQMRDDLGKMNIIVS